MGHSLSLWVGSPRKGQLEYTKSGSMVAQTPTFPPGSKVASNGSQLQTTITAWLQLPE